MDREKQNREREMMRRKETDRQIDRQMEIEMERQGARCAQRQ